MRLALAHAARWIAQTCTRAAEQLEPTAPLDGDVNAQIARTNELIEHMRAGRIRRRRGESERDFCLRVARGDYVLNENLIDFKQARERLAQQQPTKARAARW